MSDIKRSCPVCGSYTSSVGIAVRDGQDCPSCGTPAATILEIDATRARLGDEELKQRVEELLVENAALSAENRRLTGIVDAVTRALRA